MRVDDFDYQLPPDLIAQVPAEPRDSSRLFVLPRDGGPFDHLRFSDLPRLLRAGDVLVLNDTRVLPARLIGQTVPGGGQVEILLLRPMTDTEWECLVKPGKKARIGRKVSFGDGLLKAEVLADTDFGGRIIRFCADIPLEEAFERLGRVPLPPYIRAELSDPERYQTVYSRETGSAAAPTAGLHFTPDLLSGLERAGVEILRLTLHVGLGTFRPVSAENVEEHQMHPEFYRIGPDTAEAVNKAHQEGRRVIAVGTTTVRTLETVADSSGMVASGSGWTDIFIYPGRPLKAIDGLITNFHLPRSTLLMLVSSFIGRERLMEAYREAVDREYRFFSFGDAMIII